MNKPKTDASKLKTTNGEKMEKLSLHEFYFDSITRCRKTGERYGQGMFNHLCEVKPDLAEKVRGTNMDPFYCSSSMEAKFDRFITFIEANWGWFWSSKGTEKMKIQEIADLYFAEIAENLANRPYRMDDLAVDYGFLLCCDMFTALKDFLIILQWINENGERRKNNKASVIGYSGPHKVFKRLNHYFTRENRKKKNFSPGWIKENGQSLSKRTRREKKAKQKCLFTLIEMVNSLLPRIALICATSRIAVEMMLRRVNCDLCASLLVWVLLSILLRPVVLLGRSE